MDTSHAATGEPRRLAGRRPLVVRGFLPKAVAGMGLVVLAACTSAQSQMETASRTDVQRDQALRTQSLFLAEKSAQETRRGNATNGILIALQALPNNLAKPDRPYVVEAETALYQAMVERRDEYTLESHTGAVRSA